MPMLPWRRTEDKDKKENTTTPLLSEYIKSIFLYGRLRMTDSNRLYGRDTVPRDNVSVLQVYRERGGDRCNPTAYTYIHTSYRKKKER